MPNKVTDHEESTKPLYFTTISPFSVFGLGTLIFTGLEIAMHATLETKCVDNLLMAHPILQALFTFLQMHFLFVNSQVGKVLIIEENKFDHFIKW